MSRLLLRSIGSDDLPAAAVLLSERHARQLRSQPLLSARFVDPEAAQAELAALWEIEGASGAVALADGELVGFLLGVSKASDVWGPNIWVEAAGHAVAQPETVRDLYGYAAAGWVRQGLTAHYVVVPSDDADLVSAWFHLGFGLQHVHAIHALPREGSPAAPAPAPGITIRRARRGDIPVLAELELVLPEHQTRSPVFSPGAGVPSLDETVAEWESDFDDETYEVFVAEYARQVIGSSIGCSIEKSSTHRGLAGPDPAAFLGFAAVLPEHRGLGAGRALGEAVLAWAGESEYPCVVTDWRATNLLSSRAWPRLGFRETFLRLHRFVRY